MNTRLELSLALLLRFVSLLLVTQQTSFVVGWLRVVSRPYFWGGVKPDDQLSTAIPSISTRIPAPSAAGMVVRAGYGC